MAIKAVVFDIGGVLIELHGAGPISSWCRGIETPDELDQLWVGTQAVQQFETGALQFSDFCQQIVAQLDMTVSADAFAEAYPGFVGFVRGEVLELVERIDRERIRVGCLSNANEVLAQLFCARLPLQEVFDPCCLSHETGYMKPQPQAYTDVAAKLGIAPENILFVDDNVANVQAAEAVGMRGFHLGDFRDLAAMLEAEGVLQALCDTDARDIDTRGTGARGTDRAV